MILAIIDLRDEGLYSRDGDWPARNAKDALQIVSKIIPVLPRSLSCTRIWIFYAERQVYHTLRIYHTY